MRPPRPRRGGRPRRARRRPRPVPPPRDGRRRHRAVRRDLRPRPGGLAGRRRGGPPVRPRRRGGGRGVRAVPREPLRGFVRREPPPPPSRAVALPTGRGSARRGAQEEPPGAHARGVAGRGEDGGRPCEEDEEGRGHEREWAFLLYSFPSTANSPISPVSCFLH